VNLSRILVFDEDVEMMQLICAQIEDPSHLVVSGCSTLAKAMDHLSKNPIDLLITDSKVSEFGLIEFLRRIEIQNLSRPIPTLLVISNPAECFDLTQLTCANRIQFLLKPFDRSGLLAGVKSRLNTYSRQGSQMVMDGLLLDPDSFDVHLAGERIHLTLSEFKLLRELMMNLDQILGREHLIQKVQGEGIAVVDRAIDTHVFSLRKKLGALGDRIETVRGSGYRLRSQSSPSLS